MRPQRFDWRSGARQKAVPTAKADETNRRGAVQSATNLHPRRLHLLNPRAALGSKVAKLLLLGPLASRRQPPLHKTRHLRSQAVKESSAVEDSRNEQSLHHQSVHMR